MAKSKKKQKDFKRTSSIMERLTSGGSSMGSSTPVQSSSTAKDLPRRGQPRGRESVVSGEETTYIKGGVIVTF